MATPCPFLFLAIALALGILLGSLAPLSPGVAALALLACVAAGWTAFLVRKNRAAFAFVVLATVFLGSGLEVKSSRDYEANALRRFDFAEYADFTGRLYRSPGFAVGRTYLYLEVENIAYAQKEVRTKGRLRVTVLHPERYPSPVRLKAGDRVRVSARILPLRDFRNFGPSALADLRRNQGIHNHAVTKSVQLVEKLPGRRRDWPLRLIASVREAWQRRIEAAFSTPDGRGLTQEGAVLEALLLGERGRLANDTTASLQKSGLYHIIAISGAHIAIISALLFFVLRLARVPRRASYIALLAVLAFYAVLVEGRASVFRAVIMAVVFFAGKLLWRNSRILNTISFSAFVLLLANPFYLFDMGFELTFAATLAIILFYPYVIRRLPRFPLRMSELLALSITAQLGVLPFIARSFHRVTFAGLLLNFIAIPLTGVIMALGFAFLGLSFLGPLVSRPLAWIVGLLVRAFIWTTGLADASPVLSFRVPTPPLWAIIGYFAFLLAFLLPRRFRGQKLATAGLFAVFLAVLVTYPFPARYSRDLSVTFLDVGQGDSILVEFPGRKKMLIDGGGIPDDSLDIGETVVSPYLWDLGIKRLDYLVLTHAHPDHLNGLKSVSRNFRIGEFWDALSPTDLPALAEVLGNLGPSVVKKKAFRGFVASEGAVRMESLHPPPGEPPPAGRVSNNDSMVLRLSLGDGSFLLPGDIEAPAEAEIVASGRELRARVLKSPHHGSRSSSSEAFLEAVRPEVVVVTAGRGNLYGLPQPEPLLRYEGLGARLLRTDRDGAIRISTDGKTLTLATSRDR